MQIWEGMGDVGRGEWEVWKRCGQIMVGIEGVGREVKVGGG